jgi:hypothetical protein
MPRIAAIRPWRKLRPAAVIVALRSRRRVAISFPTRPAAGFLLLRTRSRRFLPSFTVAESMPAIAVAGVLLAVRPIRRRSPVPAVHTIHFARLRMEPTIPAGFSANRSRLRMHASIVCRPTISANHGRLSVEPAILSAFPALHRHARRFGMRRHLLHAVHLIVE